jgi:phosphate starvation-inducible PhoH-like protein
VDEAGEDTLTEPDIHLRLTESTPTKPSQRGIEPQEVTIRVKRGTSRARGANQAKYLHAIATHDINFGIGPAGTGKTFLAVAMAVER